MDIRKVRRNRKQNDGLLVNGRGGGGRETARERERERERESC